MILKDMQKTVQNLWINPVSENIPRYFLLAERQQRKLQYNVENLF